MMLFRLMGLGKVILLVEKIENAYVYGRGALDTKSSLNAIMEAVEFSLNQGKIFRQDLYLAFGGDEETYGTSQQKNGEIFPRKGY